MFIYVYFSSLIDSVWANNAAHCWVRCVCDQRRRHAHTTKVATCW